MVACSFCSGSTQQAKPYLQKHCHHFHHSSYWKEGWCECCFCQRELRGQKFISKLKIMCVLCYQCQNMIWEKGRDRQSYPIEDNQRSFCSLHFMIEEQKDMYKFFLFFLIGYIVVLNVLCHYRLDCDMLLFHTAKQFFPFCKWSKFVPNKVYHLVELQLNQAFGEVYELFHIVELQLNQMHSFRSPTAFTAQPSTQGG